MSNPLGMAYESDEELEEDAEYHKETVDEGSHYESVECTSVAAPIEDELTGLGMNMLNGTAAPIEDEDDVTVVPEAWFRELPTGVLDSLTPEQVMHCNTEEECSELVKLLPPTESALL